VNRSTLRSAAIALAAFALSGFFLAPSAHAAEQPKVPEQVAEYFADGLVPRLIDLYGSGDGVTQGIDFDATTEVGGISRVFEWTPDFLVRQPTDVRTRATNNWVASVSVGGEVLGLATVWINPAIEQPELAAFDSRELAIQLAAAPADALLVQDPSREAWFAVDGDSLTPLVAGTSGVTGETKVRAYQLVISPAEQAVEPEFSGIAVSALVLGIVILALAIFVLLPVGKRSRQDDPNADELDEDDLDEDEPDEPDEDDLDDNEPDEDNSPEGKPGDDKKGDVKPGDDKPSKPLPKPKPKPKKPASN